MLSQPVSHSKAKNKKRGFIDSTTNTSGSGHRASYNPEAMASDCLELYRNNGSKDEEQFTEGAF